MDELAERLLGCHPGISMFSPMRGFHSFMVFLACIWWMISVGTVKKEVAAPRAVQQQQHRWQSYRGSSSSGCGTVGEPSYRRGRAAGCFDSCHRGRATEYAGGVHENVHGLTSSESLAVGTTLPWQVMRSQPSELQTQINIRLQWHLQKRWNWESSSWQGPKQRQWEKGLDWVSWAVTAEAVTVASCCPGLKNLNIRGTHGILGGRVKGLGFVALGNRGNLQLLLLISCQKALKC